MKKNTYHIITYGCQMNVHESEKIAGILESLGYINEEDQFQAEVIVFNTCCIRENAEQKACGNIGALKKYKSKHKDVMIIVLGCMTQQEGIAENLKKKFPFVDGFMGTHNLSQLAEVVAKKKRGFIDLSDCNSELELNLPMTRTSGANAWVNIIYGCNNFCTYCIVPYVRGREKSRPFSEIVKEVEALLKNGYREITLLGQNVNSYGNDLGKKDEFANLLDILANLPYRYRLKFMTSHPKDFSVRVIETIAKNPNVAKSVHLPLQSGSNKILKAMNRSYTVEGYLNLVKTLKEQIPEVGITTDIMVGFPGETEADFTDTLNAVRSAEFSGAYTFVYSRRKGTAADRMDGQISDEIKKERIQRLIEVQNACSEKDAQRYIGKICEVLIEGESPKRGYMCGRTDSGKTVHLPFEADKIHRFVNVKIQEGGISALRGEIV